MKQINLIKLALCLSVLTVLALSVYSTLYIFPMYTRHLLKITEENAIKATGTLSKIIFDETDGNLPDKEVLAGLEQRLTERMGELDIDKLRIFAPSGQIIYSSDKSEIGRINSLSYFSDHVAKGKSYSKIVEKNAKTREGDISGRDVVEVYVPIMGQNDFKGALELYFDISRDKTSLEAIGQKTLGTILPFTLILLVLIVLISLKANGDFEQLKQARADLKNAYDEIEQKVESRTRKLRDTNQQLEKEVAGRRQYEKQMLLSASVFENAIEGIIITDRDGTIRQVNHAFTQITGFSQDEVIGENPRILKSNRHNKIFYEQMWQALEKSGVWKGEIWNRRKNGETYPEWLTISSIMGTNGEPVKYVALFNDITALKNNEQMLKYQANHDPLTDLPNRQLFNDRLKMGLAHASREDLPLAVLLCDIDDFKNINVSMGHYIGDRLLKKVADRLLACIRQEDTVARQSGDEFLIICPYIRKEEPAAIILAQRIQQAFEKPVLIDGEEIFVRISIGITLYPEDGKDIETLVRNADIAMYRSKAKGKDQISFFTVSLNKAVQRRINIANDLRNKLILNEFVVYYQPKVNIKTGLISGMEALLRWKRNGDEMVSPVEFIPIAEDTGAIFALGEMVMAEACSRIMEFSRICGRDLKIAVNLSVKQFSQKDLIQQINKIIEKTGLSPHLLTIEITESIVIKDIQNTLQILKQLHALGIRISIDDFGTGYSSLSYLRKMPLTELKIDKAFVDDIPGDPEACAVVSTIITLAKSLNLETVAEGVETMEQLFSLRESQCDEIQGYYYCKPLCDSDMVAFLAREKRLSISDESGA